MQAEVQIVTGTRTLLRYLLDPLIDKSMVILWRYHQDIDRMQLVPYNIYKQTGHIGGMNLWFK